MITYRFPINFDRSRLHQIKASPHMSFIHFIIMEFPYFSVIRLLDKFSSIR
jgi:hypothetical protein